MKKFYVICIFILRNMRTKTYNIKKMYFHIIFSYGQKNFSTIRYNHFSYIHRSKKNKKVQTRTYTHTFGIFRKSPVYNQPTSFSVDFSNIIHSHMQKRKTHTHKAPHKVDVYAPFPGARVNNPTFFPTHTKIIINVNLRTLEKLFSQRDPLSRKTNKM